MRGMGLLAGAAATAFTVIGSLGAAVPAQASNYGFEINGTYRATSIGELARTNEVFIDEQTTVETWTVNSSCTDPWTCTGQVTSDQGWTAPLRWDIDHWLVDREIPNWEPCPDGTTATGYQKYYFYGKEPSGLTNNASNVLGGEVTTQSRSGSCGINKPLFIKVPLRVEKIS